MAVVKLVSAEGVSKMSASFSWAGVLAPPTSLPRAVEIVSDAAPVLELALDMLDSNREPRPRTCLDRSLHCVTKAWSTR
jgi:hypothetical protein